MKRAVLVNGVPASGKSTVARAVSRAKGWPLLTLDTVKEALFAHLGTGDRDYSRLLGKASYQAIFSLIRDFPDGTTAVVDAWFGFQPAEILQGHLKLAGVGQVVEVWCHAPAEDIGRRYRARLKKRHAGHLGADYVPELIELAASAKPLGSYPLFDADTSWQLNLAELSEWLDTLFKP
jgi:glucokinase